MNHRDYFASLPSRERKAILADIRAMLALLTAGAEPPPPAHDFTPDAESTDIADAVDAWLAGDEVQP